MPLVAEPSAVAGAEGGVVRGGVNGGTRDGLAELRSVVGWGLAGVGLDLALGFVEVVLELRPEAGAPSLWWNDLAGVLRIGAQGLILAAFLHLARHLGHTELWRSAVGAYGFAWLVVLLGMMPMEGPPPARWEVIVFSIVVMFAIVVTVEAVKRPWVQALPVPQFPPTVPQARPSAQDATDPTTPEGGGTASPPSPMPGATSPASAPAPILDYQPAPPSKARWGYGGSLFLVYFVCKHFLAARPGVWLAGVMVVLVVLMILATVFTVRLAIAKLRLAGRTTSWMSVSGWLDLAMLVGGAGALVYLLVGAALQGLEAFEQLPPALLIAGAAANAVVVGAAGMALWGTVHGGRDQDARDAN